jgi:hypothetical protein
MKSYRMFAVVVALVMVVLAFGPGVASAAPAPSPAASDSASSHCCWYEVQWGDTLSKIAARYGVSTWTLVEMNDIEHVNHIWAGQWLRVPRSGAHPARYYYYSDKYDCSGYSYYNAWYGKAIFICTD